MFSKKNISQFVFQKLSKNDILQSMAEALKKSLNERYKKISSSYLYDDKGSALFQQIMELPEYYLTRTEKNLLQTQHNHITTLIKENFGKQNFHLIELGCGDGSKTKILIESFIEKNLSFDYIPIDISQKAIELLTNNLEQYAEKRNFITIEADYFQAIDWVKKERKAPALFLFLGSTIGNFSYQKAIDFLKEINKHIDAEDLFLIGIDLKKDISKIYNAYDDSQGVTRQFNMNILERLNRELNANFNTKHFYHYPTYNPQTGSMESYLISKKEQIIQIPNIPMELSLEQHEAIHLEYSKKYSIVETQELAQEAGFSVVKNYIEKENSYLLSLWKAVK